MGKPGAGINVVTVDFDKRIKLYNGKNRRVARDMLRENALDLEKESKNLAPIDEGTLIGSGHTGQVKERGNTIEIPVSFSTPYAVEVHETMQPAIAPTGRTKRPGATTQKKPATRFGKAGGKYLERPLLGKAKIYSKRIADKMKKIK